MIDRSRDHLIVLNKDEDTVMYVDTGDGSVAATVEVERNPHEVAVTPDGSAAYVCNAGADTISVLDNLRAQVKDRIVSDQFRFPHGVDFSRDGRRLYMASTYVSRLFIISVPENTIEAVIPTYQKLSHMIHLSPDERFAFVANIRSNNISVLDTRELKLVNHVPVGHGPEGIAPHPNGRELWVTSQEDGDLMVLDLETWDTIGHDRLGGCPVRLVFSPDGRYALAANRHSNDVSVIDAERRREIKRIPVGIWAGGICFSTDSQQAYVANNKTNDVSVIDMESLKEAGRIEVGIHPDGIAFLPAAGS